jgi:predicted ArsR family transcriptional regulator
MRRIRPGSKLVPGSEISRVLEAVNDGWMNAPDIAEEAGIRKDKVSAYLSQLVQAEFIRRTHRNWGCFHPQGRGRRFHRYAPMKGIGV